MSNLMRFALFATLVTSLYAQSNGSISGAVKDSKGGMIPGATVTVADRAEAVSQTEHTSAEGSFVFPQLPPGTYTITVEMAGFKKIEKSDVVLPVASKVNVGDIVLEVGSVSETVTVQAELGQLQIQSDSGERSNLVTNRQLRDIALNGRNVVDMFKTVPGVIAGGTVTTSTVTNVVGGFNINGTRSLQHEYTVDGVTNLNLGNNTGALVSINPDALEEVKILTSNYQAEYGRSGGGFIALTTRGGTNEYHGGARYFRRHDSLNADTFFNDARGGSANGFPRPLYRFNYYGWDLGGPIVIPHILNGKDKLFFFISQEYYSQLVPQASSVNILVPTAAERAGDFSHSVDGSGKPIVIADPNTGQPFPGNIIPAGRIYAPGKAILNFLPASNTTSGGNIYNYTSQVPSAYPRRETILRGDWQIDSNTRLSLRWVYNYDDQQFAYGTTTASWNWPLTITERRNGPGNIPTMSLTRNFGPTLVNEFIFGAGRGGVTIAPVDNKATRAAAGISTPLLYPTANESGLIPSLTFGGIASVPTVANTSVFGTFDQQFVIWNIMDNLTKVAGKHVFKFGFYYQSAINASNSQNTVESNIDFTASASNPLNTGNPFSNALLGVYNSYTQASAKTHQNYLYHDVSWYLQDTWKIHRRLTLDLGMRFSWYQPVYNSGQPESFFNPSLFDPSKAPRVYRPVCVGAATCASGAVTYRALDPASVGAPTLDNTLPSFYVGKLVPNSGNFTDGLALTSNGYPKGGVKTQTILPQPRVGLAWDVAGNQKTVVRGGFGITYDRPESFTSFAANNPPYVFNPTLSNGYLQDITPGGAGALSPLAVSGVSENMKFPSVYSYSLGVQRNLGAGTVLDASYVGSQSRHNPRRTNLNVPGYGTTFTPAAQDPTKYSNGVIPAVEPSLPAVYANAGLNFSGANALATDFVRPYQGYSDITYYLFDGNSTYNSLQVGVHRRFSQGVTFGGAYTLSKTTTTVSDDSTYTNILSPRRYDYGTATFDRTHYFVGNYVWDMPKGAQLLGGGWLARSVLDNWTLSGITWFASGTPTELTLTISGQDAGNRLLGTYTSGNLSGQQPRFLLNGSPQSGNTINLSAFAVPGIGNIGPYPRFYLRNPGIANQDLSVFKKFPMGGEGKRFLQLRFEAFNIFNHPQFLGYNLTTNVVNAAGQTGTSIFSNFTGLAVTNNVRPAGGASVLGTYFGERNAARDPRIIQLAVKFYF
jgi:Carboxypeptidase regulatory-like domain/TonB-dependent Receptor Plug Domain